MTNTLYYGDNLEILRQHVGDESGDLVVPGPALQLERQLQRAVQGAVGRGVARPDQGVHRHMGMDPGVGEDVRAGDRPEPKQLVAVVGCQLLTLG